MVLGGVKLRGGAGPQQSKKLIKKERKGRQRKCTSAQPGGKKMSLNATSIDAAIAAKGRLRNGYSKTEGLNRRPSPGRWTLKGKKEGRIAPN